MLASEVMHWTACKHNSSNLEMGPEAYLGGLPHGFHRHLSGAWARAENLMEHLSPQTMMVMPEDYTTTPENNTFLDEGCLECSSVHKCFSILTATESTLSVLGCLIARLPQHSLL
jgi:hypothetical protein